MIIPTHTIAVSTMQGHFFFKPEEIVRLEAQSNYTQIFLLNNKKILASKVLKDFVGSLEPFGFVRTHRSHLVNKNYITSVNHAGTIVMNDSSTAAISRG
ncbi:MAG TPA: LytTR family DNA-binding domain-containing protein, partial [Saprospiraceae bacterium]|nr:LytTR family DNA-binding domain-containing protein [Saprospiraceae bacterium]